MSSTHRLRFVHNTPARAWSKEENSFSSGKASPVRRQSQFNRGGWGSWLAGGVEETKVSNPQEVGAGLILNTAPTSSLSQV